MKILLCTTSLGYGGAETHVCELASGLCELGHSVTVASSGGELVASLRAGVRHLTLPAASRSPLALLALSLALKRIIARGKFDVVHAHARIPAFLCRRYAEREGCRFVVTAHALFRMTPALRRLSVWGERTVAVSQDIKQLIIDKCGVYPGHITVIPNGIDTERFSPRPDRGGEARRILFVSRMDCDCSLAAGLLCRIAGRLEDEYPGIKITLTGGGDDVERIRALAEGINTARGRELVEVTGGRADVERLMRESDIFVGVSRAALEAAASGLAVILAGNEGYSGILSEGNTPGHSNFCGRGAPLPDADTLYSDIKKVIAMSPGRRISLGDFGRDYVLSHHSSRSVAAAVAALYEATPEPRREKRKKRREAAARGKKRREAAARGEKRSEAKLARRKKKQTREVLPGPGARCYWFARVEKNQGDARRSPLAKRGAPRRRRPYSEPGGVVICGYYGFGNAGDNAMLDALLSGLASRCPTAGLCVMSSRPSICSRRFGVSCIGRTNLPRVILALSRASYFILGGGTLLQDATSRRSFNYYLFMSRLACLCRCRLIIYGSGLGPISSVSARRRAAALLSRAEFIGLRERTAYDLLRSLGVSLRRAAVFADPALLTPPEGEERVDFLLSRLLGQSSGGRYVAVSLREGRFYEGSISVRVCPETDSGCTRSGSAAPRAGLEDGRALILRHSLAGGSGGFSNRGERARDCRGRGERPCIACRSKRFEGGISFWPHEGVRHFGVRSDESDRYEARLAAALDGICDINAVRPLFFVLSPEDKKISERILARMKKESGGIILPYLTVSEIIGLLSRCLAAVGMRLHMLVFALTAGVPAAGIAADPKIDAYLEHAGLPAPLPAGLPDPGRLISLVCRLIEERDYYAVRMASARKSLSALAEREISAIAGIISGEN